jgi:hypothetical protein
VKQSRFMSLVEATTNVVVGFGVAVLAQVAVFPLFGLQSSCFFAAEILPPSGWDGGGIRVSQAAIR